MCTWVTGQVAEVHLSDRRAGSCRVHILTGCQGYSVLLDQGAQRRWPKKCKTCCQWPFHCRTHKVMCLPSTTTLSTASFTVTIDYSCPSFFSRCLCSMHMCTYVMYEDAHVRVILIYICVQLWRSKVDTRCQPWLFSNLLLHSQFLSWTQKLSVSYHSYPALPENLPSLSPECWNYRWQPHLPSFSCGFWESRLWSSHVFCL